MSALDKAFLKAYTKGSSPTGSSAVPPAGDSTAAAPAPRPEPVAATAAQAIERPQFRRIDPAHRRGGSGVPAPHGREESAELPNLPPLQAVISPPADAAAPPPPTTEPVTPPAAGAQRYKPGTSGAEPTQPVEPVTARAEPAQRGTSGGEPVKAGPSGAKPAEPTAAGTEPVAARPEPALSTEPAVSTEQAAPPPAAKAPLPPPEQASICSPAKAAPLQLPAVFLPPEGPSPPRAFAPEWEVDRFVWPAVCQQLLEAESRYFRHVGQRLKSATDQAHHVVMITGCRRGEGRTTLALCLARSAAQAGVRTALLDADLHNPELSARLGIQPRSSWLEVVDGQLPLREAAVASLADGLTLFPLQPAGSVQLGPGDPRLTQILQAVAAHYPLIIVDAGPLDAGRTACAVETSCPIDAAIVLRDLRHSSRTTAMAAASRLQASGIAAVGLAENFADL